MVKTVWKLNVDHGRQWWTPEQVSDTSDDYYSDLEKHLLTKKSHDAGATYENEKPIFQSPEESAEAAVKFYSTVQTEDGHWAGDYGGPLFLLPGLIIVNYICGIVLGNDYYKEMIRYIKNVQRADGGWGLHIEGESTVFGTSLNYISLRILGVPKTDPACLKALEWLRKHGGVLQCPQWGKFYMCTLGVMDWAAVDPVPPELWLMPSWMPIVQPGKWWCHCRVVYLPMAYVYGMKGTAKETPLIRELREELYDGKWNEIKWSKWRGVLSPTDIYSPPSIVWKVLAYVVALYEFLLPYFPPFQWLRNWACRECIDHIKYEDVNTKFICIGPVNKVLNMLSVFYAEGASAHFKGHESRMLDYLWLSDDGMKYQGYNGSQLWDTAFAVQAIIATGKQNLVKPTIKKASEYILYTQVKEDAPDMKKYYRHISKGAWPFSTLDHGWPISDCTAEGLKASLILQDSDIVSETLTPEWAQEAVNVILSMWNKGSGGWATYENTRTYEIAEVLNPAALFGEIMVDYPHTECTSACITALSAFRKKYPNHRTKEIDEAIKGAVTFLKKKQRPFGLWYGGWAVCFCYGTWFAITGLITAGESPKSPEIQKACEALVKLQLADGGWGEHWLSCVNKVYVQNHRAQVVNTSWALLALMKAEYPNKAVIEKGIQLLMRRQLPNGDFPQENISGVFNHNCAITYTNYRNIFPIWALGEYINNYSKKF